MTLTGNIVSDNHDFFGKIECDNGKIVSVSCMEETIPGEKNTDAAPVHCEDQGRRILANRDSIVPQRIMFSMSWGTPAFSKMSR